MSDEIVTQIQHHLIEALAEKDRLAQALDRQHQHLEGLVRQLKEQEQELTHLNGLLAESEAHLKQAQTVAGVGSWRLDIATSRLTWSDETYRMFGVPLGTPQTLESFAACIHPDDQPLVLAAWNDALHLGTPYDIEHRILAQGQVRWVRERAEITRNAAGEAIIGTGTVQDITEHKHTEQALKESELKYRTLFETANDGIFLSDASHFLDCNQKGAAMYGLSKSEILGRSPVDFAPERQPDGRPSAEFARERIDAALRGETPCFEWQPLRADGTPFFVEITLSRSDYHSTNCLLAIVRDITQRKEMERTVRQLAFYDSLTELPNRRLLNDRIHQAMAASKRTLQYGALLFIDLDNFKGLNDRHGHDIGDLLLIEAARRLRGCVREMDTVARFGGDEFIVLLIDMDAQQAEARSQASTVSEKILLRLAEPYLLTGDKPERMDEPIRWRSAASIGVALFVDEAISLDELLKQADIAMYQAKLSGKNCFRLSEANAGSGQ